MKKLIIIFIAILPNILFAQNATISGYIEDATSGEKLINANIYHSETYQGSISNYYGFYSLTYPIGKLSISYSYMGYETKTIELNLTKDTIINIQLTPNLTIEEVQISSTARKSAVESSQMSMTEIPVQTVKALPVLLGEVDLLKTIQLLPGVQSGSEGTSGLYVRGGSPDQNLILLDEVPVYNVNHLFGFFSVFNSDAIHSVKLTKGGFPAHYGGRLSSVLDIKMKEGNMKEFHGEGGIGLISSRLTLEGPIIKDKSSFIISGRRTYADQMYYAYMKLKGDPIENKSGYYFYDLNAKLNYKINDKHRIYISAYLGEDRAFFKDEYTDNYDNQEYYSREDFSLHWGNMTSAFRWNYRINNKLFSNTILTYSKYEFVTGAEFEDKSYDSEEYFNIKYKSGIEDYAARINFDYIPNNNHYVKFGVHAISHTYNPGISTFKANESLDEDDEQIIDIDTTLGNKRLFSEEISAYIEDDIEINERFKANIGLHFSGFNYKNKFYTSVQPRISTRYLLNENLSIKAAYSKMTQYIHLLTNSSVGLPTDLWLPVTQKIKPQEAWQVALGSVYKINNMYEVSLEGFYKEMDNLIDYKEGTSFFTSNNSWEDNVEAGTGWAYGMEVFLEKTFGELTGWIGYTLSWSERQFDNISNGERFPYKYDRRHDISIAFTQKFTDEIDMGLTWVYGTGNAVTLPSERYQSLSIPDFGNSSGEVQHIDSRNNYRMPAYHRLDLGFNVHRKKKWGEAVWHFGVYNLYNRKNPYFLYFDTDYDEGQFKEKKVLKQVSLFPIIPSISYSFKF